MEITSGALTRGGVVEGCRSSCSLTGTLDEGPVVASVGGTETLIQRHVPVPQSVRGSGPGAGGPHGAPVGPLHANTPAGVTGIAAPTALRPLQTLGARPQT